MEKRYYYDHGLPFSTTLADNLDGQLARIANKKAGSVVLDGLMGNGKTTMAVHIADYMNGGYRKVGPKMWELVPEKLIDLEKQIGMGGAKFLESLQMVVDGKKVSVVYDEGGDFNKRASLTGFNALLNRVFETYRAFGIFPIIALPNCYYIDNSVYEKGVIRFAIHIENRGKNSGNFKVYSLYRLMHVFAKMKKLDVPQQAWKKTYPNFVGHFLDLPPERSALLEKISMAGKKEIITNNVLKSRGLVSVDEMAQNLKITKQYVNYLLRKCGAKETATHKKIRYFEKDIFYKISAMTNKNK